MCGAGGSRSSKFPGRGGLEGWPKAPQAQGLSCQRGYRPPIAGHSRGTVNLLRRCFCEEPSERPEGMAEVAECVGWIRGITERERSGGEDILNGGLPIPP